MSPLKTGLGPVARAGVGGKPRPSVSFEFSPPKGPKSEASLWEAIRRLLAEHASGRKNHAMRLWVLLILERWFAQYEPEFAL